MDITPDFGTIAAVLMAFCGTYAAIRSLLTKLETKIDDNEKIAQAERKAQQEQTQGMREDIEKLSDSIERIYALEATTAVHEQRITANEARIKKLEGAHGQVLN